MEIGPKTRHHFSDYIKKRAPEAYGEMQRWRNSSFDFEENEFKKLPQRVISCIENAAKTREKTMKVKPGYKNESFISESKRIRNHILEHTANLVDFLRAILRVFTMETFLCYYLNELLRSDFWEEINILTPFLGCLLYAFELSEFFFIFSFIKDFQELEDFQKETLSLYRGTALTKERLALYDPNELKFFTLKGMTSTSRRKDVGQKYTEISLMDTIGMKEEIFGVLFIIEVIFESIKDWEGLIDLSPISRYPKEQEVLLAPGIVFELKEVCLTENGYEISIKVKRIFDKAVQVGVMPIRNQNELISQELFLQICLEFCRLLKENKLIQSLEIKDHMRRKIRKVEATSEEKTKDTLLYGQFKPPCLGTIFRNIL